MFDFTSSKLLILGIVALLVIGPKDLPALLRTLGKYVGIIKRQAAEFRAQFDEAMRESELAELRKSVESIQQETETAMQDAQSSVEKPLADARLSVDQAFADPKPPGNSDRYEHPTGASSDAGAAQGAPDKAGVLNGSNHPGDTAGVAANEAANGPAATPQPADRASEKSGA
ncbi:MAG: twin-arginine translocase subunit TatB [Hyphomicrobiaceae bacterium]|nr:twin-arginine translocase subunit TatB [Hyphomicrobiaceae bacterium]